MPCDMILLLYFSLYGEKKAKFHTFYLKHQRLVIFWRLSDTYTAVNMKSLNASGDSRSLANGQLPNIYMNVVTWIYIFNAGLLKQ